MKSLAKLADMFEPGPNGEPPVFVFIIIGIFVFLLIVLPFIMFIRDQSIKTKQKEDEAAETRRKMLSVEDPKSTDGANPALRETKTLYDMRDELKNRLREKFAPVSPELQKRLDEQRKTKELKKTQDTINASIKPHGHDKAEKSADKNELYGSMDYCEFDDFFATSAIKDEGEEEEWVSAVDTDFTEEGLIPEYAAEYMIFGDMLNNPGWKRFRRK